MNVKLDVSNAGRVRQIRKALKRMKVRVSTNRIINDLIEGGWYSQMERDLRPDLAYAERYALGKKERRHA